MTDELKIPDGHEAFVAPEGMTEVSWRGQVYQLWQGYVVAPAEAAEEFLAHGLLAAGAALQAHIDAMREAYLATEKEALEAAKVAARNGKK